MLPLKTLQSMPRVPIPRPEPHAIDYFVNDKPLLTEFCDDDFEGLSISVAQMVVSTHRVERNCN